MDTTDDTELWRISARVGALERRRLRRVQERDRGRVEPVLKAERERIAAEGEKKVADERPSRKDSGHRPADEESREIRAPPKTDRAGHRRRCTRAWCPWSTRPSAKCSTGWPGTS